MAATALALLTLHAVPASAQSEATVVVLGLTSIEGDDDYTRNLTGALRNESSQVTGWEVSDREVTLAQMSLAHGCGDAPDVDCLRQIAATLNADRLLYGTVRRRGSDFLLTLSLFDAETGQIERTIEQPLSGQFADIDDLREPAQQAIARLSGPVTGSLIIASNAPGATVRVDGELAGTTDASGALAMPEVPVGQHRIEVSAAGRAPWSGTVTVARGTELTLDAALAEAEDAGPSGGGSSINWPAIALIGAGALSFGGTIYTWARIEAIESDGEFQAYRRGWADPPPNDVCELAEAGVPNGSVNPRAVADLCSEASTLEVLQYVFLGVAVAAVGTGAVFLATGVGAGGEGSEDDEPTVAIVPSVGPDSARIAARVRF